MLSRMRSFLAAEHLRIDGRAAYGTSTVSPRSSLNVEDPGRTSKFGRLRWPKGFKDKHGHSDRNDGHDVVRCQQRAPKGSTGSPSRCRGRSCPTASSCGAQEARQRRSTWPTSASRNLEPRALAPTGMDTLIRALAYATLVVWIRVYLIGADRLGREPDARILGGWIARIEVKRPGDQRQGQEPGGAYAGVPSTHARPRST